MKITTPAIAIIITTIIYAVGLAGFLLSEWLPLFEKLTPANLIFASIMVFAFHRPWSGRFLAFILAVFVAGWSVEWLGVNTGIIFGAYSYDDGLGFKLFEIPLIIGLNWVLLIYCSGTIASYTPLPNWAKALLGALLMVALDVLIEPFAIAHGLWSWETPSVPLRNYLAWFIVSFMMLLPFFRYHFSNRNPVAVAVYVLQLVFFGVLMF
jgi:putative membrane protein